MQSFELLLQQRELLLTGHFVGVALGLGGATVTDILFFNFLKDFKISKKEADVMNVLSIIIVIGLVLLFLSGTLLYLSDVQTYSNSPAFLSKMIIVMVITLNGILMHIRVAPKMVKLSFTDHDSKKMIRDRKVAFLMGAISFTSWYYVFFLSMLKRLIPESIGMTEILGFYGALLVSAIGISQVVERLISAKVTQK